MIKQGTCPYPDCSGPIVKTALAGSRRYKCYACARRPDMIDESWERPNHKSNPGNKGRGETLAERLEDMSEEEVSEVFSE